MKSIAAIWDAAADTFDEEADHGLRDPSVQAAWADGCPPGNSTCSTGAFNCSPPRSIE
ncbi:hypothetical protein ABGB18_04080 [Nonomuraea sp. B12E4]|uniref:hypothetical protein n=1 Tax=Nonomuraea sp. B12E4 TaxID=3153564 RepID=UPI00325E0182